MARVYNFSAGPATLPLAVLQQVKEELFDWHELGMSVMEISHRSQDFMTMAAEAEQDIRDLLEIPTDYHVLFLQGGARSQFAMVPMNLLRGKSTADYLDSGIWSDLAIKEANRYCHVNIVASTKATSYRSVPPETQWSVDPDAAYFHYVDNETINGVEFPVPPKVSAPIVSDMSSNILSRPVDISKYALIYAGAQKNIAPAGLTLVIVKEGLLGEALACTPSMFNYQCHAKERSLYNTPPTFAWYMASLMFKWLKKQGGLSAMAERHRERAAKLYAFIDNNDFYHNPIDSTYRSRMNIVFDLKEPDLLEPFLRESTEAGLANLKGHKLVGGLRASLYNALPEEAVDQLVDFMDHFSRRYG